MQAILTGVIRDGRVETIEPIDLPDGTPVVLTAELANVNDDPPMTPNEIANVLAGMRHLKSIDIPEDVAADLDAWERKVNQYGIDNSEKGIEHVFQ